MSRLMLPPNHDVKRISLDSNTTFLVALRILEQADISFKDAMRLLQYAPSPAPPGHPPIGSFGNDKVLSGSK